MDPSLNSRPDLNKMLESIKEINHDHKLTLYSEIRAESVNENMAKLFNEAGFKNLKSVSNPHNPKALEIMNRKTDLNAFLKGCRNLKLFDITPKLDLIVGLPAIIRIPLKNLSISFMIMNSMIICRSLLFQSSRN
jgi:radical SAM superfamily enzyme YgiQ (UPF0313 family)